MVLLSLSLLFHQDPTRRTHFGSFVLQVQWQCNSSNHSSPSISVGQQVVAAVDIHKRVGKSDDFPFELLDHRGNHRSPDCSFPRNKFWSCLVTNLWRSLQPSLHTGAKPNSTGDSCCSLVTEVQLRRQQELPGLKVG